MKHFGSTAVSAGMLAIALSGCAVNGSATTEGESVSRIQLAIDSCPVPASGSGSVCYTGEGSLKYQVTLPSGQQYVELFATQSGIQDVAANIVASGESNGDGTTTYSFVKSGYGPAAVQYRFYSYLPASPAVFTPGPAEQVWYAYQVAPSGPQPALGSGSVTDVGGGSLEYQVTLPSGQQYVELFVTQNGIQNVASNIVASGESNGDGTTTYSFVQSGYSAGDAIDYRFYSYLPASPGVFTPGPAEQVWYYEQVAPSSAPPGGEIDLPVTKDASLISSSFALGSVADENFGASPTVDVAAYHETAQGLLGYSLTGIPSGASVTKAELVIPGHYEGAGGLVSLSDVKDSSSWQELTVTWNTTPASTLFGDFTITPNVTNRLDVTSLVAQAVAGAQSEVSFLLASLSSSNVFIDSKEKAGGQPTYLHVEWH
jgi:hypothetical protein